jgi:type IV pilus assembly protein PilA
MNRLRLRAEGGFTLIELLVVIAIIGILAAIAIPQFAAYRKRGYQAQVWSDMRNAGTAEEAYFVDNNSYTGTVTSLTSRGYNQHQDVTLGIVGTSNQGFRLTAGHTKCTAGTWTYDPLAAGNSITGGPCS